MAGVTAQGGTFSFGTSLTAVITSISVETPTAEIVDMTSTAVTLATQVILVPTGGWSGGSVSVDYIKNTATGNVQSLVGGIGTLAFASPGFTVVRKAVLESATANASTSDIVRGTLKFRLTDHTATNV